MFRSPSWPAAVLLCFSLAGCTCGNRPNKPTLLAEGELCTNDEACETGLCEPPPGKDKVCVRQCGNDCRTGEVCTQLTPNRFACQPEKAGLCNACSKDSDCPYPADKCVVVNGVEKVCGRDCAFDQKCPGSYRCVNASGLDGSPRPQQCIPTSGTCTCTAATVGQTVSCESQNGFGRCAGKRVCDGQSGYSACDAKTPAEELCNALDDDCDGQLDEGLASLSCGVGECARTVASCAGGQPAVCQPGSPVPEACDAKDNDCDGVVDDGFDKQTDVDHCGSCGNQCRLANATPRCAAGACQVLSCNPGFDNCNGLHPDGCEVLLATDVDHCGTCSTSCRRPNALASCAAGQCGFTCLAGYYDLDGDPANGCEYACNKTSNTDLPDLAFVDANCDGLDGEVGNGLFVSPGGSDASPGTMAAPKQSLAAAVAAAVAGNKRDVYVSQGAYNEELVLSSVTGKNIAGGYAQTNLWRRSNLNTTIVSGFSPALRMVQATNTRVQLLTFYGANASGQGETVYGAWISESTGVALEGLRIQSGNAGAGANGAVGAPGQPGDNGGGGDRGCTNDTLIGCNTCSAPPAGGAGPSSCGQPGGRGGFAGYDTSGYGYGGVSGSGGASAGAGTPPRQADWTPPSAYRGLAGANGSQGGDGVGAAGLGTLSALGYLRPNATAGATGIHGRGGGGGGGGGGGCATSLFGLLCWCWSYGSTGGGGGGGGCGGAGGTPGGSGGASIAVYVWDSTINATQVELRTGSGGKGGNGALGGLGGAGGLGGGSGYDEGQQGDSSRGGSGGGGGIGGRGGASGGGGGGPVLGIARNSASVWSSSSTTYVMGVAGQGGTSPAGGAASGAAGTSSQQQVF